MYKISSEAVVEIRIFIRNGIETDGEGGISEVAHCTTATKTENIIQNTLAYHTVDHYLLQYHISKFCIAMQAKLITA